MVVAMVELSEADKKLLDIIHHGLDDGKILQSEVMGIYDLKPKDVNMSAADKKLLNIVHNGLNDPDSLSKLDFSLKDAPIDVGVGHIDTQSNSWKIIPGQTVTTDHSFAHLDSHPEQPDIAVQAHNFFNPQEPAHANPLENSLADHIPTHPVMHAVDENPNLSPAALAMQEQEQQNAAALAQESAGMGDKLGIMAAAAPDAAGDLLSGVHDNTLNAFGYSQTTDAARELNEIRAHLADPNSNIVNTVLASPFEIIGGAGLTAGEILSNPIAPVDAAGDLLHGGAGVVQQIFTGHGGEFDKVVPEHAVIKNGSITHFSDGAYELANQASKLRDDLASIDPNTGTIETIVTAPGKIAIGAVATGVQIAAGAVASTTHYVGEAQDYVMNKEELRHASNSLDEAHLGVKVLDQQYKQIEATAQNASAHLDGATAAANQTMATWEQINAKIDALALQQESVKGYTSSHHNAPSAGHQHHKDMGRG